MKGLNGAFKPRIARIYSVFTPHRNRENGQCARSYSQTTRSSCQGATSSFADFFVVDFVEC